MKLYDNVRGTLFKVWEKLEKKCPVCGYALDIVPEVMSKRFPIIECDQCHLQLEVSTRNNYRISMTIGFLIPLALAFGFLFRTFL